jgi:hypothetical protein
MRRGFETGVPVDLPAHHGQGGLRACPAGVHTVQHTYTPPTWPLRVVPSHSSSLVVATFMSKAAVGPASPTKAPPAPPAPSEAAAGPGSAIPFLWAAACASLTDAGQGKVDSVPPSASPLTAVDGAGVAVAGGWDAVDSDRGNWPLW